MRLRLLAAVAALSIVAACDENGAPVNPLSEWFNGAVHGTIYGAFGNQNTTEGPPTAACQGQPGYVEPSAWWNDVSIDITNGSSATGFKVWSNEQAGCSRAMQSIYRSAMVVDLSGFYTTAGNSTTTPAGSRVNRAYLDFNLVPEVPQNPLGWICGYMGGVNALQLLRPGAMVNTDSPEGMVQKPIGPGFTRAANNFGGSLTPGDTLLAGFPEDAREIVLLRNITSPGDFPASTQNGTGDVTVADVGPGGAGGTRTGPEPGGRTIPPVQGNRTVKVNVTDYVIGALNNNRQDIAFALSSSGENFLTLDQDVQFSCISWINSPRLTISFL